MELPQSTSPILEVVNNSNVPFESISDGNSPSKDLIDEKVPSIIIGSSFIDENSNEVKTSFYLLSSLLVPCNEHVRMNSSGCRSC